jgi:hypothetical protein
VPQPELRRRHRVPWLWSLLLVAGCASRGPVLEGALPTHPAPAVVELSDTPFFPQERYQCGPAALATVLSRSGITVSPEELAPQVFLPGRKGTLQVELVAASRRHQRLPYVIRPDLQDLLQEIQAGRPVLVLQNLGLEAWPVWHYAVVVGFSLREDSLTLRSGTTERLVMPADRFLATWQRAGSWALVLLRPGELPASSEHDAYVRAVAAMEGIADPQSLQAAYRAGLGRWPDSEVARYGLAGALLDAGDTPAAARAYRELLVEQPDHVPALNNLALALAAQGCHAEARQAIDRALALESTDGPWRTVLLETRHELAALTAPDAAPSGTCGGDGP